MVPKRCERILADVKSVVIFDESVLERGSSVRGFIGSGEREFPRKVTPAEIVASGVARVLGLR